MVAPLVVGSRSAGVELIARRTTSRSRVSAAPKSDGAADAGAVDVGIRTRVLGMRQNESRYLYS